MVEDVQNLGLYYAKTLRKWRENFDIDKINKLLIETNEPELTDSFIRMWKAYLIMSQVGFDTNKIFVHQLILTQGQDEVYEGKIRNIFVSYIFEISIYILI